MAHKWGYHTNHDRLIVLPRPRPKPRDLMTPRQTVQEAARHWLREAEAFYGREDADDDWLRQRYAELRGQGA